MNVFCFYDPADPHPLTRLWVKSWSARGWIPRLILPSETETGLTLRQVANRRGGGIISTASEVNFSRSTRKKHPTKTQYPDITGDTVIFARSTEDDVLHCGRPLDAD